MKEKDIIALIEKDGWMMSILRTVQSLHLPDWWIGAGFVRSKVWDHLHNYKKRTALPDIDVIYFDIFNPSEDQIAEMKIQEKTYEEKLNKLQSDLNWSVKDQSRMHKFHNEQPYKSSEEALSRWVETATCVGVSLNKQGKVVMIAPHGIDDLVNLLLRPTPGVYSDTKKFYERMEKKDWRKKWPKLEIVT